MKNILIIGSSGKMGQWFVEYFYNFRQNFDDFDLYIDKIFIYDIKKHKPLQNDVENNCIIICNNIEDFIKEINIIIFCTPVDETVKLIKQLRHLFRSGMIIIEISSMKKPIFGILSEISLKQDIVTLCIHPMFGPGALLLNKKNKIIHIPVNTSKFKIEENLVNRIFPQYEKIIIKTPEQHDQSISVVISLIYFINLIFSRFLLDFAKTREFEDEDNVFSFLKKISGSSFKMQSLLSESILTDDIALFMTLFTNNDESIKIIHKYQEIFNNLLNKIDNREKDSIKEFIINTKEGVKKNTDIDHSYDTLYRFLNSE